MVSSRWFGFQGPWTKLECILCTFTELRNKQIQWDCVRKWIKWKIQKDSVQKLAMKQPQVYSLVQSMFSAQYQHPVSTIRILLYYPRAAIWNAIPSSQRHIQLQQSSHDICPQATQSKTWVTSNHLSQWKITTERGN